MMNEKNLDRLVNLIYQDRQEYPKIWHVGVPGGKSIVTSLRGFLDKNTLIFQPVDDERASCCGDLVGDNIREHCRTKDHIRNMILENHNVEEQTKYLKKIILADLP